MSTVGDFIMITQPRPGQTLTANSSSQALVVVSGSCSSTSSISVTVTGQNSASTAAMLQPVNGTWNSAGFPLSSGQSYTVSAKSGTASASVSFYVR